MTRSETPPAQAYGPGCRGTAAAARTVAFVLAILALAGTSGPAPAQPVTDVDVSDVPGASAANPGLLEVADRRAEGVLELRVGPFFLPHGMPHMRAPAQFMEVPFDGWIHGFRWRLVDRDGNELPDRFLHHVNVIDVDHRELFSPIARRIMAAGRETKAQSLPQILGVPVEKGDRWAVVVMLANSTGEDHPRAYLELELEFSLPDDHLVNPRNVFPFYTDVMPPVGDKSFPVPPGRTVKSWTGSPLVDARLLALGGHLHDYGKELRLEEASSGDVLWSVEPETEGPHHVKRVPVSELWMRGGIKVEKERDYRVVAVYQNPLDGPSPNGGMGVVAGAALADPADFPPLDRQDPDYVRDLWNTLTAPVRTGAGGAHDGHGTGGQDDGHGDGGDGQGGEAHDHGASGRD